MSRWTLTIINEAVRARAVEWAKKAPIGMRLTFQEPKRSNEQNDLLWPLLTDVSCQHTHMGRKYAPEVWKCLFMHELGRQCEFVPSIDGQTVIPLGFKSSNLSKKEMSDLITFILQWGDENGVKFSAKPAEELAA